MDRNPVQLSALRGICPQIFGTDNMKLVPSEEYGDFEMRKLFFIGPMGAGKTTVGKLVAESLHWKHLDNDEEMSLFTGLSRSELSNIDVKILHKLEREQFERMILQEAPFVAGAAASIIDSPDCVQVLRDSAFAVYLALTLDFLLEQSREITVGSQAIKVNGNQIVKDRYYRRDLAYRKAASLVLDGNKDPSALAFEVVSSLSM